MRQSRAASVSGARPNLDTINKGKEGSHGNLGSNEQIKASPLSKLLTTIANFITLLLKWYQKTFDYRRETILLLVLTTFVYTCSCAILLTLQNVVYPDYLILLLLKLIIVSCGFVMYGTFLTIESRKRVCDFILRHREKAIPLQEILDFPKTNVRNTWARIYGRIC
jgi:hypothetical protein